MIAIENSAMKSGERCSAELEVVELESGEIGVAESTFPEIWIAMCRIAIFLIAIVFVKNCNFKLQ